MPLLHQRQGRNVIFISAYSLWLSIVKDVFKPMDGIHFFRGKDRENKITIMVRQNETSRFEPWIAGLVLIIAASSTNICILISNFMSVLSWSALVSLTLAPLGVDLRFVGSEIKTKRPFCFVFRSLIRTFGFRPKLLTLTCGLPPPYKA